MDNNVAEFEDLIGGQDGGHEELTAKGNPFHLRVTRHKHAQYALTVSRKDAGGQTHAIVHFWLTHEQVQKIAALQEASSE